MLYLHQWIQFLHEYYVSMLLNNQYRCIPHERKNSLFPFVHHIDVLRSIDFSINLFSRFKCVYTHNISFVASHSDFIDRQWSLKLGVHCIVEHFPHCFSSRTLASISAVYSAVFLIPYALRRVCQIY